MKRRRAGHRGRPVRRAVAADDPLIGSEFVAEVRDLASDGRGVVAHPAGLTVLVDGVWTGERGRFRVESRQRGVGRGRLLALQQPSPHRRQPLCPHPGFGAADCGGCPWQFVAYAAQLEAKQQRVAHALARLGLETIEPILGAAEEFGYRNRAQLKTDGESLGYVSRGSRRLAAIRECPVLSPANQVTLAALLAQLPNRQWRPRRGQDWTTLNLDDSAGVEGIRVNRRTPFRQGHSVQNQRMRDWLAAVCAGLRGRGAALELFCGSGNFTEVLAGAGFAPILAVDAQGEAIEALRGAGLANVDARALDLYGESAVADLQTRLAQARLLLLDPPRSGFADLGRLVSALPLLSDVVYISCDLATFARDLAQLQAAGFSPRLIQPLDQMPQTPHVELLAHLAR